MEIDYLIVSGGKMKFNIKAPKDHYVRLKIHIVKNKMEE